MAYTVVDYPSKKKVKEALARGEEIRVYQPGPFGPKVEDGTVCLEGPHYPKPHSWYGTGVVKGGVLRSLK